MKLFIKLRNKYFTALASLVLLVLASIGLFNLCTPQSVEASMIKFDNEKTITITNGSFTTFSSSSNYPYTLSSFSTSGTSTADMKTGAINIGDTEYAKNYTKYGLGEYDNPKGVGSDNYILMINAGNTTSNYTYTSSDFTLPANGSYYITVSAKAMDDNTSASIYLTQNNVIFKDCVISNISSRSWTNYTFFVTTNSYESVTLKLGMQLGGLTTRSSGCILFDELHAGQISTETLNNCLETFQEGSYKQVKLNEQNAYKEYNFDNKVIEYTRDDKGNIVYNNNKPVVNEQDVEYFTIDAGGAIGEKYTEIVNNTLTLTTTNSYIAYKGEEEVLQPNTTYRFSMFVKASSLEKGSAYVNVDEILDEEDSDTAVKFSNLTISSVTSNAVTDGYQQYIIYVNTGSQKTSKVQFSFGLGKSGEYATGQVSFKSYTIERVPYSAYNDASTGNTVDKFDIADRLTLNSKEFSNYTFDKMQSNSFDGIPYPAIPTSWTKTNTDKSYQLSGVVNLSEFDKVMAKYKDDVLNGNTITTPAVLNSSNNNVLMMFNGVKSTQSYTSSSKTLTANKYYKVTTFVYTHLLNVDSEGATIIAKTGSTVLGKITGIDTSREWQRVVFYINAPSTSVNLTLELALGYDNATSSGYAFFDNVLVEEADEADGFTNLYNQYPIADEKTIDLTNLMLTSTDGRQYNTPILYTGTNKNETNIEAGIIDLSGDLKMIAESKREALSDMPNNGKNALAIVSMEDKDGYYEYVSVLNYSFESGKYYKLSFDLFTDGISQEDKENKYDNGRLAEGVNVELTNLENAKFSYIQSNGAWTGYEFYIGVNSKATSNLKFSLGSEFTGCYGKAFLGNIVLEEIEETEFTTTSASETVLKIDTVEVDEDKETETTEESKGNNFSWVYIPTIATFLAIVVAVVGVFIRRNMKFKKRVKNGKAEYDRDITVMQNKYRRLASDERAKEVRELTKERDELVALRVEYEEKYKDALSRLRSARLANRDGSKRNEIIAIEHEVKHISKEVARFGVQVNNYDNEIEFMQTEAYLIDLEKRMMREDTHSRNQLRKEAEMSEEDRIASVAKREAKQQRLEDKAKAKADKLASKQAKLQQEREQVQAQLQQAKEMDEKYVKEQELKQIRLQEQKVAAEKAKAERELQKLEQQRAKQSSNNDQTETQVEKTEEDIADQTVETAEENTEDQPSQTEEVNTAEETTQTSTTADAEVENKEDTQSTDAVEGDETNNNTIDSDNQ